MKSKLMKWLKGYWGYWPLWCYLIWGLYNMLAYLMWGWAAPIGMHLGVIISMFLVRILENGSK